MIYILFILSLIAYVFAPNNYSIVFCNLVLILFLFSVFVFYKKYLVKMGYVNFHVFFLISFFFVNYIYPNFIYPIDPEYFFMFGFDFDYKNISRGLALAQLAIISYMVGVISFRKNDSTTSRICNYSINTMLLSFVKLLLIISTVYIVYVIYSQATSDDGLIMIASSAVSIYIMVFTIYVLLNSEFNKENLFENRIFFLKSNAIVVFSIVLVAGFALWYGDRGIVIQIGLIMLFVYFDYVKKIALRYIFAMVLIGFILMTFISSTRNSENNMKDSGISNALNEGIGTLGDFTHLWEYGKDFIINSRNNYVSFEIVEETDFLYGKGYFPYLFSPIPRLPLLMTDLVYNSTPEELSTARIISLREGVDDWGLGTNAVGDVYMNFGALGVVCFFCFFGFLIRWLELDNNIYKKIAFLTVISMSLYLPRASLISVFEASRTVFILWILLKLFKVKKLENEDIIY